MSKKKSNVARVFDEKGKLQELKVPKGMIVQTIYRPEKGETLIPSFAHLSVRVKEQEKTNDPAVIIVCAPIDTASTAPNKYFVSTQNTLGKVDFGDRATVQKKCNAEREEYMAGKKRKTRQERYLYSLVA